MIRMILRIALMIAALIGVIYVMKHLKTTGVNKELFYLNESQKQATIPTGAPEFELCETRVKDVQFKWNGKNYDIHNSGRTWAANDKELPSVEMEKWLVLLCKVKAERLIDLATSTQKYVFPDQIVLNYVNGNSIQFGVETPAFMYQGKGFYSRQLLELVNNLRTMITTSGGSK